MLRAKIHHDFLNGALTISHLKLTQHCTSNLPQSSQHVKCNADCWSGCFSESHSLTSCCLPRSASIWNNYWIFTLRGSVLLARFFFTKLLTMSARRSWEKIQDATAMMFSRLFPYIYIYLPGFQTFYQLLGDKHFTNSNGHETDNPWPKFQKDPKNTPSHEDSCQSMGLGGQFQPKCAIIYRISRDLTNLSLRQTYLHNLMVLHFWDLHQILHHYPFVVFG